MSAPVATIDRLAEHVGRTVTLRGWLHNKSSKGKLHFVQLRDGAQDEIVYTTETPS